MTTEITNFKIILSVVRIKTLSKFLANGENDKLKKIFCRYFDIEKIYRNCLNVYNIV